LISLQTNFKYGIASGSQVPGFGIMYLLKKLMCKLADERFSLPAHFYEDRLVY
jgi:hypothetical protein